MNFAVVGKFVLNVPIVNNAICPVARPHRPPVIIANSVDAQEASCVEIWVKNSIYIVNAVLTFCFTCRNFKFEQHSRDRPFRTL